MTTSPEQRERQAAARFKAAKAQLDINRPETFKVVDTAAVEHAHARTAIRRAEMTPIELARAAAITAGAPELFKRTYIGPGNAKGRQAFHVDASQEDQDKWRGR